MLGHGSLFLGIAGSSRYFFAFIPTVQGIIFSLARTIPLIILKKKIRSTVDTHARSLLHGSKLGACSLSSYVTSHCDGRFSMYFVA